MSEVMLHGYPVKVGDRVWSFTCGELVVTEIDSRVNYPIITTCGSYNIDGALYVGEPARIFWKPIDPAAFEAAKVKPKEPEYEWQWLYRDKSGRIKVTACHYMNKDYAHDAIKDLGEVLYPVEESKRESLSL